jgi:CAAX protease family protein
MPRPYPMHWAAWMRNQNHGTITSRLRSGISAVRTVIYWTSDWRSQGDVQTVFPQARPPEQNQPQQLCPYCGAPLLPGYYFCSVCATPYKNEELVLPQVRPAAPTTEQLVRLKAPHVMPLFCTYVAVVIASSVLLWILAAVDRPEVGMIVADTLLFITTGAFAARHWRSLAVQFRRFGFFHPAALIGLIALVPLLGINYAYHTWLTRMLEFSGPTLIDRLRDSGIGEPALIFFIAVFPGVVEEIAFRGLVQHWLQIALTPMKAMVLASALFAALHFSIISLPYLFMVGMLLGWTKWKTGSLYPAMLIHFLHNLIVLEFF